MFGKRRIAILMSVVLVVVIGILIITSFVLADSNRKPETLIGAWSVEVFPEGQPPSQALVTFFSGGQVVEDQRGTGESSGHGLWVMDKQGQVRFTVVEILWNPADDAYTGKFVVTQVLAYDAASDTWSGPSTVTIYDAAGEIVFTGTVPAKFTRIQLEPAP